MATLDDRLDRVIGKRSGDALTKAFGFEYVRDLLGTIHDAWRTAVN